MDIWVKLRQGWSGLTAHLQTCEHNHTQMSRKQTDGGMSQLLAMSDPDSKSQDPKKIAGSSVIIK